MKKWSALFLAMVMTLSLCACGKDGSGHATDAPTTAPTVPAKPTDPTYDPGSNGPSKPENSGNDGPATPQTGNFNLLTEFVICYYDGDEREEEKMELVYDEDYCLIGIKGYENGKLTGEMTFDKETGKMLTQVQYNADGGVDGTGVYTYDEKGNELSYVTTLSDGSKDFYRERTYTAEGWLESSTYGWGEQSPCYREVYTYDDYGNKLTQLLYIDDACHSEITYENSYEDGKLRQIKTWQNGMLAWGESYDADGNLIAEDSYNDQGEVFSTTAYTYENGKLMLRSISSDGVESSRQEYTYNEAGQLVEVCHFDEGHTHGRDVYAYKNGVLVNVKLYDHTELEGEYTLSYQRAEVSEELSEKLTAMYEAMMEF